ncbi:hypothetical protein ELE36_14435 [Pseudolysobacter antarcticus]|uniref:Right-handed parallel beta-helix repeat-containing protein n=1 Tax=Pseudolysobacter antarcticus TaxID=2511995 RepID=A0A411HLQ3_9GAMM|nr:right-handed parallel beta-helix repeat-containing protein [Pseudolysobacter antarcticus]QBB71459.1 hypothetical protein ELE36_14435 [Pseudolysobacter antarcticus]
MKFLAWVIAFCIGFGLLPQQQAHAIAPICVHHNDSAGLTQALANAVSSGISATIEVEQGTYTVPPTGWYYPFAPRQDISLLGGYIPSTNCQQRLITASPSTPTTNTVLDGQSQNGAAITFSLQQDNPGNLPYGTLVLEGFEIRNLQSTSNGKSSTGLYITHDVSDGYSGGIVFRYNWVHNVVTSGTVVQLDTGGALNFTNNLLDQNVGAYTTYVLSVARNTAPWRIVNNTIANNTGEGLALDQHGSYLQLFNNILYANSSFDLDAVGAVVELHADTYGTSTTSGSGSAGSGSITNHGYAFTGVNPGYDATTFHLNAGSGSINTGAAYAAVIPSQDLDGNPRWIGSNPDRGAFESNASDQAYWVVTNATDSSHATDATVNCNPGSTKCTLREAVTRANATGPSLIAFHLAGSCGPQLIALNSPLPAINNAITVDGYSQPGAASNTVSFDSGAAFNPVLCVIVRGSIGSNVSSAFVAGPTNFGAQLDVRGITFEGFAGAAVSLSQGTYHWIHGDSFGIETNNSPFVFSNAAGVLFGGGAIFNTLGGTAPADLNMLGKMSDATMAAVTINASSTNGHLGNQVVGNLIGMDQSHGAVPNQGTGLLLQNSDRNEIRGNVIVASALDGISLIGASSNWLHDNAIGTLPQAGFNYVSSLSNGGSGIVLSSGSANNAIGVFDKTAYQMGYSNVIQNNKGGPGVWLNTGAGVGNTVLSNSIGSNGPGSGSGGGALAIDFGPLGSAVGGGDAISIFQSYMLGSQTVLLNFVITGNGGDPYRIDFYANINPSSCDASGYGPAELPIQTYSVVLPGSGTVIQGYRAQLPVFGINQSPSYVTATATNLATSGGTSQVSNCATLLNDRVFADSFEAKSVSGG